MAFPWPGEGRRAAQEQRDGGPRRRRGRPPAGSIWPQPAADGAEARPVHALPHAVQERPRLCPYRRGVYQADDGSVARRLDNSRRRRHQRAARLHPGRPGGEVAQFDPQHAVGRGEDPAQRAYRDDSGRAARARRHRVPRIRGQDSGRHPPHRGQEPAHGGSGADRQIGAVREVGEARLRQGDGRRPRVHGLFRHPGRLGPGDRDRRRHRRRHRARAHQPDARRRQPARDAAAHADQEVRLRDHRDHSHHQRDHLRLWPFRHATFRSSRCSRR